MDSGKFYPRDVKTPEGRLRFYAARFPLVEVDTSFYAITTPDAAVLWVERTHYLYSEKELSELAASVRQLSGRARVVHVLFNNSYTDYAQRNALEFMQLLDLH